MPLVPLAVGRSSAASAVDLLVMVRSGELGRSDPSSLRESMGCDLPPRPVKELKVELFGSRDFLSGVPSGVSPILPAPAGILLSRRLLNTVPSLRSPRGLSDLGVGISGTVAYQYYPGKVYGPLSTYQCHHVDYLYRRWWLSVLPVAATPY